MKQRKLTILLLIISTTFIFNCQKEIPCENCITQDCNSNRPIISVQITQIGSLSVPRWFVGVASAGNLIMYAGGQSSGIAFPPEDESIVDIYNTTTNTWSIASLSEARYGISTITVGSKIFFAGGITNFSSSSVVDIYDINTNTWSVSSLSSPRGDMACAKVGNKVLFAGGRTRSGSKSNRVDIYDLNTELWSIATLSESRTSMSAVTVNNKVYFAGGNNGVLASNRIDIFDNETNSWSTDNLQLGRSSFSAITINNKIYWAGGFKGYNNNYNPLDTTCSVEIFDVITGTSSTNNLHIPSAWHFTSRQCAVKNNKILFPNLLGNEYFDMYDLNTNTWSIGKLPRGSYSGENITNVNNKLIYLSYNDNDWPISENVYLMNF